jgi:FkbH-like protein
MYQAEEKRAKEEEKFVGPRESFLASLDMHLRISPVTRADLERAEELCNRTNQLNTTGYSYSMDELDRFRQSQKHRLLIASLDDKFGSYGKIGLCLIECQEEFWIIRLFLMSCRVITRGVGMIFLRYIINLAKQQDVRLQAEFKQTSRNRMMLVTYKFAGFEIISEKANALLFENNYKHLQPYPGYVKLNTDHS